ncbi:M15 family metallopeptidase [Moorena sp. SIO1G6]|uniref:M15 family metallopeptidase n=1 Tax=unclassified Moorena TaxID=2683338 RepID=UPI00338E5294
MPDHHHRQLLKNLMYSAGFRCHPREWWHFCLGDQMWAWLRNQENATNSAPDSRQPLRTWYSSLGNRRP